MRGPGQAPEYFPSEWEKEQKTHQSITPTIFGRTKEILGLLTLEKPKASDERKALNPGGLKKPPVLSEKAQELN